MDALASLAHGFSVAMTPTNLLFVLIGVTLGQLIGALPGIGPSAGMALLLPVTFGLEPVTALVMLSGIMYGGMYGGTLTSVLVNVPGEAASVMTAVDGNQLARQGRAGQALAAAAIGSFLAGIGAVTALAFLTPILSAFALGFSAPEYFLLALLGITATASLGTGSAVKAMIGATLGLMIALVGTDPIQGTSRLTFGSLELLEGIDFLPVAIGVFGIAEILVSMEQTQASRAVRTRLRDMWLTGKDWAECRMAMLRGGLGRLRHRPDARRRADGGGAARLHRREEGEPAPGEIRPWRARRRSRGGIRQQLRRPRRHGAHAGARHTRLRLDRGTAGGAGPARHPPRPDAAHRAGRPRLGPHRLDVRRQRDPSGDEPAARPALRQRAAHPLFLSRAGHPRRVAGRRLCHQPQPVQCRADAVLRHGRLPDDPCRHTPRAAGTRRGAGAADGKLAAPEPHALGRQPGDLRRASRSPPCWRCWWSARSPFRCSTSSSPAARPAAPAWRRPCPTHPTRTRA